MADIKAIKELALYAAKKQVPVEFANKTVADVNDALRAELKELCGNYNLYRRNKLDLFEIMQETMDEIVPAQVAAVVAQFAEIKQYANGTKAQFKIKKGKLRARKFATRATASGVYETSVSRRNVSYTPLAVARVANFLARSLPFLILN